MPKLFAIVSLGASLSCLLHFLLAVRIPTSLAFTVPPSRCRVPALHPRISRVRFAEPPDASTGGSSGRRRRRKAVAPTEQVAAAAAGSAAAAPSGTAAPAPAARDAPPLVRPRDAPVELKVQNVRQVVGSGAPDAERDTAPSDVRPMSSFKTPLSPSTPAATKRGAADDSLQQLLIDAQEMRSIQGQAEADASSSPTQTIRNVLSTIVTVDFFVVCGFLLWFLAGIFCSTVLRDDTVQIAFNSNFQAFVQPALGVLMIASIASAVVGGEDNTDKDNQ